MAIHKHSLSSTHLSQLSSISRCASLESLSNLSSGTSTRTQSTNSLQSMLSSLATTPDYSPRLIDTEVGNLLDSEQSELDSGADVIDDDKAEEKEGDTDTLNSGNFSLDSIPKSNNRKVEFTVDATEEIPKQAQQTSEMNDRYDPKKHNFREKWLVCLIGLPACGKSTVVKQFIDFAKANTATEKDEGIRVKSFNAGDIRRKHEQSSNRRFSFDMKDKNVQDEREKYAFEALKQLIDNLVEDKIDIGVLDATNTTRARREGVFKETERRSKEAHIKIHTLIFEVRCTNRSLRRFNIDQKAKNKDYDKMPKEKAICDFLNRIERYESIYEPVTLGEITRLKAKYFSIANAGETICYDCEKQHKDTICHENLTFNSAAMNLMYDFLMSYRCLYAMPYLKQVEQFYTENLYKPIASFHLSSSTSSLNSKENNEQALMDMPNEKQMATIDAKLVRTTN